MIISRLTCHANTPRVVACVRSQLTASSTFYLSTKSAKVFWGVSNQKKAGLKIQHVKPLDMIKLQIAVN